MTPGQPETLGRHDAWAGLQAVVVGFDAAGFAAADNLTHLGASVTAFDAATDDTTTLEKAELLEVLGARVHLDDAPHPLPEDTALVVVSPGRHDDPLVVAARTRGIAVWGDVELAWRLRDPAHDTPWLAVTGSHGTRQTVGLLESILRTAGRRCVVVGCVGLPVVEAVMDPEPYDVLVVALSEEQLRDTGAMSPQAAVVLNVADEATTMGRIYERVERACVYNVSDAATEEMVREADVLEGARAIGFTLGMPPVATVGVVEDILADRAFIASRASSAAEICTMEDVGPGAGDDPHLVANALAAAALALAHGVSHVAVRDGLRAHRP